MCFIMFRCSGSLWNHPGFLSPLHIYQPPDPQPSTSHPPCFSCPAEASIWCPMTSFPTSEFVVVHECPGQSPGHIFGAILCSPFCLTPTIPHLSENTDNSLVKTTLMPIFSPCVFKMESTHAPLLFFVFLYLSIVYLI